MTNTLFPHASASHPQWQEAAARVIAQLRVQLKQPNYAAHPKVGLLYFSDGFAADAHLILTQLRIGLPMVQQWSGAAGVGVIGQQGVCFDGPALSVMLLDLEPEDCRVFSGVAPLPARAQPAPSATAVNWALVHADPTTPDLADLISELAGRTRQHQLYGGLVASRATSAQVVWTEQTRQPSDHPGIFFGGLSGLAFSGRVPLQTAFAHGVSMQSPVYRITSCEDHVVLTLNDRPALDVLLEALDVSLEAALLPPDINRLRATLVGLSSHPLSSQRLEETTWVRGILGLDSTRNGVALSTRVQRGQGLVFCHTDAAQARAELMRACADIREALSPPWPSPSPDAPLQERAIRGVVHVCCAARGTFWQDSQTELQVLRAALGDDLPITGFYAAGEVMHDRVHAYGSLLLVFCAPDPV